LLTILSCHSLVLPQKTLAQTNKGTPVPLTSLVSQMYKDQGIAGFYRGVSVNVMRACILNATKMGVYDISKGYITAYTGWERKDIRTAFGSAFVAGFFMTCTVSPADNLRTRLMNQPTDKKIYTGFTDCLVKTVKQDGFLSLWVRVVDVTCDRSVYAGPFCFCLSFLKND